MCLSALAHVCSYVNTSPSFPSSVPQSEFQTLTHRCCPGPSHPVHLPPPAPGPGPPSGPELGPSALVLAAADTGGHLATTVLSTWSQGQAGHTQASPSAPAPLPGPCPRPQHPATGWGVPKRQGLRVTQPGAQRRQSRPCGRDWPRGLPIQGPRPPKAFQNHHHHPRFITTSEES